MTRRYNCPYVSHDQYNVQIQGFTTLNGQYDFKSYSLILGTCEDLSKYTGRTDCAPADFVNDNL